MVAGAVAGSVLSNVVGEIATRMLSDRQQERVGLVVIEALATLRAKEVMGETIRADDFFDGERSSGDEFIEGVLRAALDEFEERKLSFYATLIASVIVDQEIDIASANRALLLMQQLSWIELQVLAIFWAAELEGRYVLPDHEKSNLLDSWFEATVNDSYIDLVDKYRLITHPAESEGQLLPRFQTNLSSVKLTNSGRLVAGLSELEQMPQTDLAPVFEALAKELEAG